MVSLSSWRANNAFLFSVKDGRDRLHFGIQLLPHRVVVYTAEKAPIYFTYNWQDGRQHPFAFGVRTRSVSFYADCGAVQQWEQTLGRSQTLGDSGGLFTLGRMNSKAAPFNGRVCQLDIYPSAQAAAHYCNYLKTQCRLADTYRLPLPNPGLHMEANNPPFASTSLPQPESPTSPFLRGHGVLDLAHSATITTTQNMWAKRSSPPKEADLSENSTEEESSSGVLQTPGTTPGLISPAAHVKEGNSSIASARDSVPQQTRQWVETHLRANGTTLYRENQVDTSEQHELDGSYDDVDMGEYDYGYEEPDFFYEYEDGFRGPKGEPGLVVSL